MVIEKVLVAIRGGGEAKKGKKRGVGERERHYGDQKGFWSPQKCGDQKPFGHHATMAMGGNRKKFGHHATVATKNLLVTTCG